MSIKLLQTCAKVCVIFIACAGTATVAKEQADPLVAKVNTYASKPAEIKVAGKYKLIVERNATQYLIGYRTERRLGLDNKALTDVAPVDMSIVFTNSATKQQMIFHRQFDKSSNAGLYEEHYVGDVQFDVPGTYAIDFQPPRGDSSLEIRGPVK